MVYINLTAIVLTATAFAIFRKYRKADAKNLWPQEKYAGINYGLPLYLWDKIQKLMRRFLKKERISGRVRRQLEKLMPLCTIQEAEEKFYVGIIRVFLGTWFLVNILAVIFIGCTKEGKLVTEDECLTRPKAGEPSYTAAVSVETALTGKKTVDVTVSPSLYTDEACAAAFEKAKAYLMVHALGANTDWMAVRENLNFIKEIPETGILAEWEVENYELLDDDGRIVKTEVGKAGESTQVTVKLYYEDKSSSFVIPLKLLPPVMTEEESLMAAIHNQLLTADKYNRDKDILVLPESANGYTLTWADETKAPAAQLFGGCLLISILCAAIKAGKTKSGLKARESQLILDYPDFVYKLVLLNGAGMGMKLSVEAMLRDAKASGKGERYVWQEVQAALRAMAQGVSEIQAYEQFGQRCAQLPYLKLSSLMVQSLKKGVGGMHKMMSDAADEAVMMKREAAVKAGENVSVQLLLPMGLLLTVVLVILVVPAFMTMNL